MKTREWANLNKENILQEVIYNENLNKILSMTNTNDIWNNLIEELNTIINKIAPTRIIQIKKNSMPYFNKELDENIKECDEQLTKAITTKELEEWRLYRSMRNTLYKYIEIAKDIYYSEKLQKTKDMWKCIKDINNTNKTSVPRRLNINGKK